MGKFGRGGGGGFGSGSGGVVLRPKRKSTASAPSRPSPARPAPPAVVPAPATQAPGGAPVYDSAPREAAAEKAAPSYPGAQQPGEIASGDSKQDAAAPEDAYHDFGASIYLSNDDTMSLSSAQRVLYAIDRFLPIDTQQIRPHELLNYFSFDTARPSPDSDFSVQAEIQPASEPGIYTLGLSIAGRPLTTATRRNAALSFVVDRSGSMADEGRMNYLVHGLTRMTDELKTGDLVNLVLFDHEVCVPFQNFVVGRDSMDLFRDTLARLSPRGSTDLYSGLSKGYELADASYQPGYTNRVVMITDALANTGVTDSQMISLIGQHYDARRIRLSGVGVGSEFNDELLDRLTERGRGAYVFLGSEAEVDAVFGDRFVSLIETVANDVHFQLHLPPSLRMNVFYGEESSAVKEDVQAVHYFAGTSQLFLSDLMAKNGQLRPEDDIMLTIEYEHPETGRAEVEEYAFNLGEISRNTRNVQKGRLVMSFIDGIYDLSRREPEHRGTSAGSWVDPGASEQCELGRQSLADQARALEGDPEVRRVVSLWEKYCARYEPARNPVHRRQPVGHDVWPGAR
jgi:Ca-activated chloride channel family protein